MPHSRATRETCQPVRCQTTGWGKCASLGDEGLLQGLFVGRIFRYNKQSLQGQLGHFDKHRNLKVAPHISDVLFMPNLKVHTLAI